MDTWDWNTISVLYGEWWLFVLFLLTALVFGVIGYFLGRKAEEREWRNRWDDRDYPATGKNL